MVTRIITKYQDKEFSKIENSFYSNFSPDDWDYIIVGDDVYDVDQIAFKLKGNLATNYEIKDCPEGFIAVVYHS